MSSNEPEPPREQPSRQQAPEQPAVNLEALAQRVYKLLKEDLRVERERSGHRDR